ATALVVSSDHERRMVEASAIGGRVTVIPLPIDAGDSHPSRRMGSRRRRTVAVLGFIYPGKGHGDVVEALAELPGDVELLALGRASDGHDALAAALVTRAERMGRDMRVTGFLPDATLSSLLRSVDVPVVPAATTSASATLGTWIAAGRRPLAASNPYTTEVAAAASGLVHLYQPDRPGALGDAVATALDDPAATWHSATVPASFTPAAVGARHRRLYRRLLEASCAR
ncbi:MAG: glycosyltransferase, partial [Acidimicrobiia bacterium]|nr:glycosyltransferase [Acidimicrobiia bacterium]